MATWRAAEDRLIPGDGVSTWSPTLEYSGGILELRLWFESEADCNLFIDHYLIPAKRHIRLSGLDSETGENG